MRERERVCVCVFVCEREGVCVRVRAFRISDVSLKNCCGTMQ